MHVGIEVYCIYKLGTNMHCILVLMLCVLTLILFGTFFLLTFSKTLMSKQGTVSKTMFSVNLANHRELL